MSEDAPSDPPKLLPNLGAEEGEDWRAYPRSPHARAAARLWALLFSKGSALVAPDPTEGGRWTARDRDALWPSALGPPSDASVWPWLESEPGPVAWLATSSLAADARAALGVAPGGPDPEIVARLIDKAWSDAAARELGLMPRPLADCVEVLEPADLADAVALETRLSAALERWPDWTRRRFTLKPRRGSSGRGRVGGSHGDGVIGGEALRGALGRLAARGGALFEPWLDRSADLSVCLRIPSPRSPDARPTLVGSLEMLASPSGVFRGHCGEVDNRGRVFSGDREDESLRADAAAVALRAQDEGFFGVCGVDAFRYRERDRERLRGLVELNARPTMGLVTIGLVQRALAQVREPLELTPGARRAFLLTILDPAANVEQTAADLCGAAGRDARAFPLAAPGDAGAARPLLVFARSLAPLRAAHRAQLGC